MWYRLLADLLVVAHLAFVLFVVLGGLLVLRHPRLAWVHLPAAAWGTTIEFTGWICPLTPWEQTLRQLGGVVPGAVGALLGQEICQGGAEPAGGGSDSSCTGATIGSGLIGALIGGGIGYFLGRSTPKYRPAPASQ